MTTTASGSATPGPASCRVASSPSSSGIRMSNRQTSGRSWRARRTAARPSTASPTTSMSGWASSIIRSPVRMIAWSSATSTRMATAVRPPPRQLGLDQPAAVGRRTGLEHPAEQGRPLVQPGQAVPVAARGRGPRPHRRPGPSRRPGRLSGDPDDDLGRLHRVPDGVGHRLLHDAVDRGVHGRRQVVQVAVERAGRPAGRRRGARPGAPGRRRRPAAPARRRRRRRAARRPWPASPPACAPPPPRSPPAPRRRPPGRRRRPPGRPGRGSPSPRRGAPRCRAAPGRAAPARGTHPLQLALAGRRPEPHRRPDHRRGTVRNTKPPIWSPRGSRRRPPTARRPRGSARPEHDVPAGSPPGQRVDQHEDDQAACTARPAARARPPRRPT